MECHVQWVICVDILRFLHFGHQGTKLSNIAQTDTACSQPTCQAKEMCAHVINLRGLSHVHFPDKHAAIRDNPYQIAFFKTAACFANRSAADIQHLRQFALVNSVSCLQFSADNHPLQFFRDQRTESFCAPAFQVCEQILVFHLVNLLKIEQNVHCPQLTVNRSPKVWT